MIGKHFVTATLELIIIEIHLKIVKGTFFSVRIKDEVNKV